MKAAFGILALFLVLPAFGQFGYPNQAGNSASIHGTISGSESASICSVELRSANGFTLQHEACSPAGFFFTGLPRGQYVVAVQAGTRRVEQQVDAEMEHTEVQLQLPKDQPPPQQGSVGTVSVGEMMVPEKARGLMEKAANLVSESKFKQAEQILEEALKIAPRFSRALALRAVIDVQNRDLAAALESANSAVASDAQLPFAQFVRAMVLNATGKFKDAMVAAQQGLRTDDSSWQGHYEMAHALFGTGDLAAALREVGRAEGLAPKNFADIHVLKTVILVNSNLLSQAEQELAQLHKTAGHDPRIQQLDAMLAERIVRK